MNASVTNRVGLYVCIEKCVVSDLAIKMHWKSGQEDCQWLRINTRVIDRIRQLLCNFTKVMCCKLGKELSRINEIVMSNSISCLVSSYFSFFFI